MNLVEIQMKGVPQEDTKYLKSWLIVSFNIEMSLII